MENKFRDNLWLEKRLNQIWQTHFPDVKKINRVYIIFGRKARNVFGSIKARGPKQPFRTPGRYPKPSIWLPQSITIITINGNFKNPEIPNEIIDLTIAHELVHYAHGFSSPHPQLYQYPHQGSVVTKELIKRGLSDQLKFQKTWIKNYWHTHL